MLAPEFGGRQPQLTSRDLLSNLEAQYPGDDIPRPPFWGGFRVLPDVDRVLAGPPQPPARPAPL